MWKRFTTSVEVINIVLKEALFLKQKFKSSVEIRSRLLEALFVEIFPSLSES
jgi:hypothetical protein